MSQPPSAHKATASQVIPVFKSEPKVYPRSVSGRFTSWRWFFVWLTQAFFFGLCWLPWNGRQAVLFDLDSRRFYLFDLVLWPQDTIYLAILLVLAALALFLFTTVAGRLWCGYSCPQTVYTEIFLWIEGRIEGDRSRRIKLDAAPWTPRKIALKSAKHGAWLLFGLWTGVTFVGYFTPIRTLVAEIASLSPGPWEIFWVLFYGFATYGNAGFLREQMCKYICPYARFQFVMFDPDTLIITYDTERGEPRGGRRRGSGTPAASQGDCVDCGICVQVCPTGIDIRNGLQNECIGCAACIDACDQVMDKMNVPRGLIRYSTENAVLEKLSHAEMVRRALRPRTLAYASIFIVTTAATAWSLATRVPLKVDILRDRAALSREADDGSIENTFQLQISNASELPRRYLIGIEGMAGATLAAPAEVAVAAAATESVTLAVRVPPGSAPSGSHPIRFRVEEAGNPALAVSEPSKFWMP